MSNGPTDSQFPQGDPNAAWSGQGQPANQGGQPGQSAPGYGQPGSSQPSYGQQGQGQASPSYQQSPSFQPTPSSYQPGGSYPQSGAPQYPGYNPQQGQPGQQGQPAYGSASAPQFGQPGQPNPYGTQAAPQYGQPGGPAQFSSQPPSGASSGSNKKLLIGIVAGVLVLALVGLAIFFATRKKTTAGPGPTDPSSSAAAANPGDAVKGYLEAIAGGNAETALSYAKTTPTDTTFLTDAVLKTAMTNSPITDIKVSAPADSYSYANVGYSYKLGTRQINDDMSVEKIGDVWKVSDVAADVNLGSYSFTGKVPMMLNGVAVNASKIYLFPGTYTVTSGWKYVDYGTGKFVVDSPNAYPSASNLQPTLNAAGVAQFKALAKAKLDACMKAKQLAPAGCGFAVRAPSGVKINPATISWAISYGADAIAKSTPKLEYDDPTSISEYLSIGLKGTAKATNGDTYSGTSYLGSTTATITKDAMTVSFKS